MNKKVVVVILILFLILVIIFIKNLNNKNNNSKNPESAMNANIVTVNDKYLITKDDGEEVYTDTEEEAQWYIDHPDYNPEPVHIESEESGSEAPVNVEEIFEQ